MDETLERIIYEFLLRQENETASFRDICMNNYSEGRSAIDFRIAIDILLGQKLIVQRVDMYAGSIYTLKG